MAMDERHQKVLEGSWQDCYQCTTDALKQLRLCPRFSDAVIRIQGHDFPVHRLLLCIRSKFFETLFAERWNPGIDGGDIIEIGLGAPVSKVGFSSILDHIYEQTQHFDEENIEDIWKCAGYFQIKSLQTTLVSFMKSILRPKNCLKMLELVLQAESVDNENARAILNYVQDHADAVFSDSEHFKECEAHTIKVVFEQISITEQIVLGTVQSYMKQNLGEMDAECQREYLEQNDILWIIDYTCLDEKELLNLEYLTSDELIAIRRQRLGIEKTGSIKIHQPKRPKIRQPIPLKVVRLRGRESNSKWVHQGKQDAIRFSLSVSCLFWGIATNQPKGQGVTSHADLTIQDLMSNVIAARSFPNHGFGKNDENRLFLVKPIRLEAHHQYDIVLKIATGNFERGNGGSSDSVNVIKDTNLKLTVSWMQSPVDRNATSVFQGQIPAIYISPL